MTASRVREHKVGGGRILPHRKSELVDCEAYRFHRVRRLRGDFTMCSAGSCQRTGVLERDERTAVRVQRGINPVEIGVGRFGHRQVLSDFDGFDEF